MTRPAGTSGASPSVTDTYLAGLLAERKDKVGNPEALAAIDAEIKRVGGTPPDAVKPKPGTVRS